MGTPTRSMGAVWSAPRDMYKMNWVDGGSPAVLSPKAIVMEEAVTAERTGREGGRRSREGADRACVSTRGAEGL